VCSSDLETSDAIEAEGVDRARRAIGDAELVILVVDASQPLGARERAALEQTSATPRIVLGNKMDRGQQGLDDLRARLAASATRQNRQREEALVAGSVMWPNTIGDVRAAIARLGWDGAVDANRALVASMRQIQVLTRARESLGHALATLETALPIDLVSADLRDAVAAYGEVTGDTVTEEVLDGIFARFCVGK
jgi:tRNA modification GTPase